MTTITYRGNEITHAAFCDRFEEFLKKTTPAMGKVGIRMLRTHLSLFLKSMEGSDEPETV